MAEPVGFVSGVFTLAVIAIQSTSFLVKEFQTFNTLPHQARELLTELLSLTLVLRKLSELGDLSLDVDLDALKLALEQCKEACDNVREELLRYCPHSGSDRASFRGWLKLKCGGGGLEGFRQQLLGYKSIITVALSFANLRTSVKSAEAIQACRDSIATTTVDLEAYLEAIQQKLEDLTFRTTAGSDRDPAARQHMEEEQRSTEKALQFCTVLSQNVERIQVDFFNDSHRPQNDEDPPSSSGMIFDEGLDGVMHHLRFTRASLEKRQKKLSERLGINSAAVSAEVQASRDMLENETKTVRRGLDFFSAVDSYLESQISNIENHAKGNDTIQIMVSTNGQPLNGRNQGTGDRLMQGGGQWSEACLQQVSQDFKSIALHHTSSRENSTKVPAVAADDGPVPAASEIPLGIRREPGFRLGGRSASAAVTGNADGTSSNSQQPGGEAATSSEVQTSTRANGSAAGSAVNRRR